MTNNVRYMCAGDAGAPSLTGAAGSFIGVLDACLVNGYNSKTVTLTQSGGTVTALLGGGAAHGFVTGQLVRISGASPSDYNGDFYITEDLVSNWPSQFTYTIANTGASSPATGTITAMMAPLDWTKPYTGTNLASYRTGQGNQRYLRIDDTGTLDARAVGYGTMTDVNTGTDPFPNASQISGGLFWGKSTAGTTATAHSWFVIGNEKLMYIGVDGASAYGIGANAGTTHMINCFGDFISFKQNDLWNTLIIGGNVSNTSGTANQFYQLITFPFATPSIGHYMIRNVTGDNGSYGFGLTDISGRSVMAQGVMTDLNPCTLQMDLEELFIGEVTTTNATYGFRRGKLPGVFDCQSNAAHWSSFETFGGGSGFLSGRTIMAIRQYAGSNCGVYFDITNGAWPTS